MKIRIFINLDDFFRKKVDFPALCSFSNVSRAQTDMFIVFYDPKLPYNYEGLAKMKFLMKIEGGGQFANHEGQNPPSWLVAGVMSPEVRNMLQNRLKVLFSHPFGSLLKW